MTEVAEFKITEKQREAFLYFLDDTPRVIEVLEDDWRAPEICRRAMVLADLVEDYELPAVLYDIDKAILKAAVEKNEWLIPYEGQHPAAVAARPSKLATLRECAKVLEGLGIEVDHLPS